MKKDRKLISLLVCMVLMAALLLSGCQPTGMGAAPTESISESAPTEESTVPDTENTLSTEQTQPQQSQESHVPQETTAPQEGDTTPDPTNPREEDVPQQTTDPTEPDTVPPTTAPQTPTSPTEPTTPQGTVIAGGRWDGGSVTWQVTSDGVLTIAGNRSVQGANNYIWKQYADIITRVVIEDGIVTVPENAFSGMTNITSVYLGQQVTKIYYNAFQGCSSLQSVTLPASLQTVGQSAFGSCTGLKAIYFAPGCSATIESYAFAKTGITELTIPSYAGIIEARAFSKCESLERLTLDGGTIRATAFADCTNLKHLTITANMTYTGGNIIPNVTSLQTLHMDINEMTSFDNMKKLTSVTLGNNRTKSGTYQNCTQLEKIQLNHGLQIINSCAFWGCTKLTSVTIPSTVTTIDNSAFRNSGVSSLVIPASVTSVGIAAFKSPNLHQVTFLGDAPEFINYSAFSEMAVTVYYPADNPTWTEELRSKLEGNITWIGV